MSFLPKPKNHYADVVLLPISYGEDPIILRGMECLYSLTELKLDNGFPPVPTHWYIDYDGDCIPVVPVCRSVFVGMIVA